MKWSAEVVMALATIIRKTGISFSDDIDVIQIMLSFLSMKKDTCKYVVNQMDGSVRYIKTQAPICITIVCKYYVYIFFLLHTYILYMFFGCMYGSTTCIEKL